MMIYSSGMPVLYIIGTLQFFFTYWVDKFLCMFMCNNFLFSFKSVSNTTTIWDWNVWNNTKNYGVCFVFSFCYWFLYVLQFLDIHILDFIWIPRLPKSLVIRSNKQLHKWKYSRNLFIRLENLETTFSNIFDKFWLFPSHLHVSFHIPDFFKRYLCWLLLLLFQWKGVKEKY